MLMQAMRGSTCATSERMRARRLGLPRARGSRIRGWCWVARATPNGSSIAAARWSGRNDRLRDGPGAGVQALPRTADLGVRILTRLILRAAGGLVIAPRCAASRVTLPAVRRRCVCNDSFWRKPGQTSTRNPRAQGLSMAFSRKRAQVQAPRADPRRGADQSARGDAHQAREGLHWSRHPGGTRREPRRPCAGRRLADRDGSAAVGQSYDPEAASSASSGRRPRPRAS